MEILDSAPPGIYVKIWKTIHRKKIHLILQVKEIKVEGNRGIIVMYCYYKIQRDEVVVMLVVSMKESKEGRERS